MTLQVTQVTLARPGRSAHWVGISLHCPHGSTPGQVSMADTSRTVVVHEVHQLIHDLIGDHGRAAGCVCAAPLALFCWPSKALLRRDQITWGGGSHAKLTR